MGLFSKIKREVGRIAKQVIDATPMHYVDKWADNSLKGAVDVFSGQAQANKVKIKENAQLAQQNANAAENERQRRLKAFQYLSPNYQTGATSNFNPFKTLLGQ